MSADKKAEPLRILSIGAHPADIFDQSGAPWPTTRRAATGWDAWS